MVFYGFSHMSACKLCNSCKGPTSSEVKWSISCARQAMRSRDKNFKKRKKRVFFVFICWLFSCWRLFLKILFENRAVWICGSLFRCILRMKEPVTLCSGLFPINHADEFSRPIEDNRWTEGKSFDCLTHLVAQNVFPLRIHNWSLSSYNSIQFGEDWVDGWQLCLENSDETT